MALVTPVLVVEMLKVGRQFLDELADDIVDLSLGQRDRRAVDRRGRTLKDRQDAAEGDVAPTVSIRA